MPLGNAEVALNAWIEPSGELRVFLARTDSWDEYGRLLKIGGLRIRKRGDERYLRRAAGTHGGRARHDFD